jgi:hypothetical protein
MDYHKDQFQSDFPSLDTSMSSTNHQTSSGTSQEPVNLYLKKTNVSESSSESSSIYIKKPECPPDISEDREPKQIPGYLSPSIPYIANVNYGPITRGSLVLIDTNDNARALYRKPEIDTITEFNGRFIAVSYTAEGYFFVKSVADGSRGIFYMVQHTKDGQNIIWTYTINRNSNVPESNLNFSISATLLHIYVVGDSQMWILNSRTGNLVRIVPLPINDLSPLNIPVVAGLERSAFTAGVSARDEIFHDMTIPIHTGYIAHISTQGTLQNMRIISGINLHFRGMYFKDKLYVTGSFEGDLVIGRKVIPSCMKQRTSFILCLTAGLDLEWWRFLASPMGDFNVIGDITVNDCDEVFTTCRFRNSIAISEPNCLDMEDKIKHEGDAAVLLRMKEDSIIIRTLPIGDSKDSSDYIAIANDGTNIAIAGFSNVSLMNRVTLTYHMFSMAFTNNLDELYYNPMAFVEDKNFSRIIAMSHQGYRSTSPTEIAERLLGNVNSIMVGSVYRGALVIEPFGLQKVAELNTGFFVLFKLEFPRLVGIVTDSGEARDEGKCIIDGEEDKERYVSVQFTGYSNALLRVNVSRNYFINEDRAKNAIVSTNQNGRFFGSGVKDGILLLKGL